MKRRTFCVLGAAGLAGLACRRDVSQEGEQNSFVRVSPRDRRYFELSDGSPFIPVGLNIAFPRFDYEERSVLEKLEERFRNLAANGGNLVRIWMGHPFYDVEHEFSGKYDSIKLRRIDRAIALARRYGIRLTLCFEHFRNLGEEPPEFPGAPGFGKPIHHVSRGGPAKNMTEFLTSPKCRERFKKKIAWFAQRYRDEPAVFAWELWHEINEVAGDGWREWTREMLGELHRRFPHHLATQSVGRLDMFRKRLLYSPIWSMPENDIAQVHQYLDGASELEVCRGPMDILAADAVRTVLSLDVNKPVLLAETGAVEAGTEAPSKLYELDLAGTMLHDILFAPFFAGSGGSGQAGHWYFYVEKNNLWDHFARFAEVVQGLDPPGEAFQAGQAQTDRLRIYCLRGRKTFLAWVRDKQADWRAELLDGRITPVRGALLDLKELADGPLPGPPRVYDPWKNRWTDAPVVDGRLELPEFLRSLVIRAGTSPAGAA